jgi:hypothetical protein
MGRRERDAARDRLRSHGGLAGRQPFSRHRSKRRDPDDFDAIRAYEFLIAHHGYSWAQIEEELSAARTVALLDAAVDRLEGEFAERVEASRMAAIFASGKEGHRAYQSWRRKVDRNAGTSVGLAGEALERAIMSLAASSPDIVVFGNG